MTITITWDNDTPDFLDVERDDFGYITSVKLDGLDKLPDGYVIRVTWAMRPEVIENYWPRQGEADFIVHGTSARMWDGEFPSTMGLLPWRDKDERHAAVPNGLAYLGLSEHDITHIHIY